MANTPREWSAALTFPLATLLVNVLGSFLIGLLLALPMRTMLSDDARVLLVVGVVGWVVRRLVHAVGLSGVDRALGGALGLARGALVACILVLLMGFTTLPREPDWRQSQVLPMLMPGALALHALLPEWAARQLVFDGDGPHSNDTGAGDPAPTAGVQAPGI